jgi:hypothetical protein
VRRRSILIAAVTVAVLAIGGVAYATVVDSTGVIHGCVTNAGVNGSHALVVQDTGTSCPKGTSSLNWNQAGPGGGSVGVATRTFSGTGTGSAGALCDPVTTHNRVTTSGYSTVVGGGGEVTEGTGSLKASDTFGTGSGNSNGDSSSQSGWTVASTNDSDQVSVTVICAK